MLLLFYFLVLTRLIDGCRWGPSRSHIQGERDYVDDAYHYYMFSRGAQNAPMEAMLEDA